MSLNHKIPYKMSTQEKEARAMHKTLLHAIKKAGGKCPDFEHFTNLENISVKKLVNALGIHHIRFIFREPKGKKQ